MVNRRGFLLIHAACSNVILLIVMNSCANIHNIVSELGLNRRTSRLEKKNNETSGIPRIKKTNRGNSGDSWPVCNRGIT